MQGTAQRREQLVLVGLLALLTGLAWVAMARMAGEAPGGGRLRRCCASFGLIFWMWVVMMAGMMIPSVTPMVLTHAAIMRRRVAAGGRQVSSVVFLAGYLATWCGFALLAALAQWALHRSGFGYASD
jgi:predicted metal-binding membrane protein